MAQTTYRNQPPYGYGTKLNTETQPYPATISNSATTIVNIACESRTQHFNYGFVSVVTTLPASGSALQIQFGKYDSTNSFALVNLTAATDITSTTQTLKKTFQIPALTSLTDPQRRLLPADTLVAQFIAAGSVTTQAVGAICGVEFEIIGTSATGV